MSKAIAFFYMCCILCLSMSLVGLVQSITVNPQSQFIAIAAAGVFSGIVSVVYSFALSWAMSKLQENLK